MDEYRYLIRKLLRYLKRNSLKVIACLVVGYYFYYFTRLLIEPDKFGAFKISHEAITLGEIGGFVAGVSTPIGFILLYATFKLQQQERTEKQEQHSSEMYGAIQAIQPKLLFTYLGHGFEEEHYDLCFIFKIINTGQAAVNFEVTQNAYSEDEDDLSNFFTGGRLDYIPANTTSVVLKLHFSCISIESFDDLIEIPLFLSYVDINQVSRNFTASLRIQPRTDIKLEARITEQTKPI